MFLAVGVLTWMIFWMRKQAVNIKVHLHDQIQSVLTCGSSLGLAVIAYFTYLALALGSYFRPIKVSKENRTLLRQPVV